MRSTGSGGNRRPAWQSEDDPYGQEVTTMPTRQRVKHVRATVDILVVDRQDHPILIGEVQGSAEQAGAALARMKDFLEFADLAVPFVMIVDHKRISIYRADEELCEEPIFSTRMRPIMDYYLEYDDESRPKRKVGESLLRAVALGWLQDVSYRWRSKSTFPPVYEELDRIGLVRLLEDGIFESEVVFGGHRLYRDESPDRADPGPGA
jgi:hypothetical protein